MATTRASDFLLLDYSSEINLLPRTWSLLTGMDMFSVHNISTTVAQVERVQEVNGLFAARSRGGERNFVSSETAQTVNFNVPFFPLD
jgi:hypothetical protein